MKQNMMLQNTAARLPGSAAKHRLLWAALALALLFSACARAQSAMRVRNAGGQSIYDGQEQTLYAVEEGSPLSLSVRISRTSGKLSLLAEQLETGEIAYRGLALPTSDFSVGLPGPGTYRLTVTAERFCGSFEITAEAAP